MPKKIYEKTEVPVEFEQPLVEDNVRSPKEKEKEKKVKKVRKKQKVVESKPTKPEPESDEDSDFGNRPIKQEKEDYDDELEPTDFVTVKIEPVEYDSS